MATNKQEQPWDKLYSTYWWEIYLDGSHPQNSPKGHKFTGYSKKQGHDEAKDKEQLLMRRVLALASHGYIERSEKIIFHYRPQSNEFINKATDPVLFTLRPTKVERDPRMLNKKYDQINSFLDRLYKAIRTGERIDNILPKQKATFSKDDYFDVSKWFFKSREQLDNHCRKLSRHDHPFDAIMKFHADYVERNPFLMSKEV